MSRTLLAARVAVLLFTIAGSLPPLAAQADWPRTNRDLAGTRYSPQAQINTRNVASLKQVWSYKLREEREYTEPQGAAYFGFSEATPIFVNGLMYLPVGNRVVALESETGKEVWRYELSSGRVSNRGVAYWPGDRNNPQRIIFTSARRMIALNAKTGRIDPGFGKEGEVDLVVPYSGAPTVFGNLLFVGANVGEAPVGPSGNTRAYDARTGAKLWEFHSVPQPGEPGHETWEGDSWKGRSGINVWGPMMTVDEMRGIVYMTFGGPATDYYGGDRHGANLFANSLVALDAATGKYKWHFQAVHHDLWDYDLPPAPALFDITRKGKTAPALAQVTKTGWMFILNRETGQPVFGVEERPVPKSDVPGEASWPTQPFPVKPPALARVSYKPEDMVTAADTTPEHAKACQDLVEKSGGLLNEGPFTPFPYRAPSAPPRSAVNFPSAFGGANWGGTAYDPKTGYIFVNTQDTSSLGWIEDRPAGNRNGPYDRNSAAGPGSPPRFEYVVKDEKGRVLWEKTWPCQKPPWGRLTAVNASTGDIAWQVPLGITEELPPDKQHTGRYNLGGPIVTAGGLVFIGATNDRRFRAFDSKTGKELWVAKLPYSAISIPMTYQGKNGKQYVAIVAAGGMSFGDVVNPTNQEALVVFALP
jgi:quinoprotein glucose dehydrogenase